MYFSLDFKFRLIVSQVAAVLNLAFFSLISGYSRWTRNKLGEKCFHRSYLIIHRVSKNKQNYFFVVTTSNFHQIRQFLAQRWQIV